MAINIFELTPNKVSRDLSNRKILIYSKPKAGKTTFATSGEKVLLIATEIGYSDIPEVIAQDTYNWVDFKLAVRQLQKPEAREKFSVIAIDTAAILYDLCEKYVCQREGVSRIGDIPYGAGWGMTEKEFFDTFQILSEMKYGLIFTAHEKIRIEKSDEFGEREYVSPDLSKRAYNVINRMVDLIAYIKEEYRDGKSERFLYTRGTQYLVAGSRNPFLKSKIKLGYDELVEAYHEAINEQERVLAGSVTDGVIKKTKETEEPTFLEMIEEAKVLWQKIIAADPQNAALILSVVKGVTGKDIKLSELTEDQVDVLKLILVEMREIASNLD